ncbi:MAG: hypothetical protein GY925_25980, partial [Actinomycetia bacterium]|nr:hypothetical protein [Actinomycetes bacterium]
MSRKTSWGLARFGFMLAPASGWTDDEISGSRSLGKSGVWGAPSVVDIDSALPNPRIDDGVEEVDDRVDDDIDHGDEDGDALD